MSKPRVALLGLGVMGSGMAQSLLRNEFPLAVYNRNVAKAQPLRDAGARVASSPRDAAADADVVISMVADDQASRTVWAGEDGALGAMKPGGLLIESSTLSVGWVKELAELAHARGHQLVDAPVTGSRDHAASGTMLFLAGGSIDAIERARPVLAAMGRDVVVAGPTGSGALLKLINNFLCGAQAVVLAEMMAFVERSHLDRTVALDMLMNGAGGSPVVKTLAARMTTNDYTPPNFVLRLMAKDLTYARQEAAALGVTLETATTALGRFQEAIVAGHSEQDFAAVVEPLREKS